MKLMPFGSPCANSDAKCEVYSLPAGFRIKNVGVIYIYQELFKRKYLVYYVFGEPQDA